MISISQPVIESLPLTQDNQTNSMHSIQDIQSPTVMMIGKGFREQASILPVSRPKAFDGKLSSCSHQSVRIEPSPEITCTLMKTIVITRESPLPSNGGSRVDQNVAHKNEEKDLSSLVTINASGVKNIGMSKYCNS